MSVRVRFAPSPTGLLHVGALRTCLFDALFARRHGGKLILRIEDTDRTRYNAESEAEFISTLAWAGIEFDEGPHVGGPHAPYRQSERKEAGIYAPLVQQLLDNGTAYYAFETPEELDEMRQYQQINKMPTGYFGGDWRDATPEKVAAAQAEGRPGVIRLRIPRGRKLELQDAIRGRLEWDSDLIDDPVLIKADGMPTYHFAAMVDDHLMGITHVLRGEEWISSAPKHAYLFEAFGWDLPIFIHCPVITGTDGKKLSKRHGATRVLDYVSLGFLREPLLNFVALIGWSPGDDREVMTPDELVQAFDPSGIQPSPGKFDMAKLDWMNGLAIRALSADALFETLNHYLHDEVTQTYWATAAEDEDADQKQYVACTLDALREAMVSDPSYVKQVIALEQERVTKLSDFGPACHFFLLEEVAFDEKATAKAWNESHVADLYRDLADWAESGAAWSAAECETQVKTWASNRGIEKIGPVVAPVRVALTGKMAGPGLFDLMSTLGPARMARRFRRALSLLPQGAGA